MTETLAEKTCTPCRGGIPPLARDEALRLQKQAPDWDLCDEAHRIERAFRFRNFREALGFIQRVGELAETEGHHPDISFGWGYATSRSPPRRSRDCTRTTSSWRARSTACSIGRLSRLSSGWIEQPRPVLTCGHSSIPSFPTNGISR
jgi:4a-hydroxytetrahydrobiopterin dehydratase